ncbi:MAG: DNA adenine methylase [Chloroflexota bacterium]|nr:DNA adenine methylase [Chloroflexota bacterium]
MTRSSDGWRADRITVWELGCAVLRAGYAKVQLRCRLDPDVVARYAEVFASLPPVEVVRTPGGLVLADGFHRAAAARQVHPGTKTLRVLVRDGTLDDALARNVTANLANALALTTAERNAGMLRLRRLGWSYAQIGREFHLSKQRIDQIVKSLDVPPPSRTGRQGDEERLTKAHWHTVHAAIAAVSLDGAALLRATREGGSWFAGTDDAGLGSIIGDAEAALRYLPRVKTCLEALLAEARQEVGHAPTQPYLPAALPSVVRVWSYPGGKSRLAPLLVDEMEPWLDGASEFHEPFVGGGAVVLEVARRYRDLPLAVNDLDPGVSEVWRAMAEGNLGAIEHLLLGARRPSVASFARIREEDRGSPAYLAFRSIFLSKTSFSGLGDRPIGGQDQSSRWKVDFKWKPEAIVEEMHRISDLVAGRMTVRCEDGAAALRRVRPRDVAYLDPPYVVAGASCYEVAMDLDDHARLADHLRACRGRWLLSMDDDDSVRDAYAWARVDDLPHRYSMAPYTKTWRPRNELLIRAT